MQESPDTSEDMEYIVSGGINEPGRVEINGTEIPLREDNTFNTKVRLQEGVNHIEIQAIDEYENVKAVTKDVTYTRTENSPHETDKVSYTKKAEGNITVDGDLSEWIIDNKATKVTLGTPNNIVNFATMWNDQYLYIAAEITDDIKLFENSIVYQNDAFEVFINPGNEKIQKYMPNDKQLFVGFTENGTELYKNTNSQCLTGWKNTDTGYTVEMAIPWLEMGVTPSVGTAVGFDLSCDDKDKAGDRESVILWAGTNDNWKDTTNFGTLYLVDKAEDVQYVDKPQTLPGAGGDIQNLELTARLNGEVLSSEAIAQMNDFDTAALYAGDQKIDPEAFIYQQRVMVPVRAVAQLYGKTVTWNQETQQEGIDSTVLDIPADTMTQNGETTQPAYIYLADGQTSIPIDLMKTILAQ